MKVGDKVIIKECHKIPELVGKEAEIVAEVKVTEDMPYGFQVVLTDWKMSFEHPLFGKGETTGPFPFREDELELVKSTEIPDVFKQMDNP